MHTKFLCVLLCLIFSASAFAEPPVPVTRDVKLPEGCWVAVLPVKLAATATELIAPRGFRGIAQTGGESTLDEDEGFIAIFEPESSLTAAEFEYVCKHPRLVGIEFIECDVSKYDLSIVGKDRTLKLLKVWSPHCNDDSKWRKLAGNSINAISLTNCEFVDDNLLESWSSIRGLEILSLFQGWAQVIGAREPRPSGIAAMSLSSLPRCASLTELSVDSGDLKLDGYANIWRCKLLMKLNLSIARADDSRLKGIGSLAALRNLTISGTAIKGSVLSELQEHPCLERVELSRNKDLDGSSLSVLGSIPNLETVNFKSSPGVTGENLAFLSKCGRLRHLALANCERLTSAGLKWLLDLVELRTLVLDDNSQLTPRVLELAGYNAQLQLLSLCGCDWVANKQLEDVIEFFPDLEFLNIVGTKCTGGGFAKLAGLKKVNQLWVDNCYISSDDINKFKKAVAPREVHVVHVPR